jgi:Bacterial PH domain
MIKNQIVFRKFNSKISLFFWFLFLSSWSFCGVISYGFWFENLQFFPWSILGLAIFLTVCLRTSYVIQGRFLICRQAFWYTKIALDDIKQIDLQNDVFWIGRIRALSFDGVVVRAKSHKALLLSPADKAEFAATLLRENPQIRINEIV